MSGAHLKVAACVEGRVAVLVGPGRVGAARDQELEDLLPPVGRGGAERGQAILVLVVRVAAGVQQSTHAIDVPVAGGHPDVIGGDLRVLLAEEVSHGLGGAPESSKVGV